MKSIVWDSQSLAFFWFSKLRQLHERNTEVKGNMKFKKQSYHSLPMNECNKEDEPRAIHYHKKQLCVYEKTEADVVQVQ